MLSILVDVEHLGGFGHIAKPTPVLLGMTPSVGAAPGGGQLVILGSRS